MREERREKREEERIGEKEKVSRPRLVYGLRFQEKVSEVGTGRKRTKRNVFVRFIFCAIVRRHCTERKQQGNSSFRASCKGGNKVTQVSWLPYMVKFGFVAN